MIETKTGKERVLLAGVALKEDKTFATSMAELAGLAKTAGAIVIDSYQQERQSYDSKYLLGSGKVASLKDRIVADDIDTVIVNNRLTPRQNTNLEEALGIKVIDRMQLILDIFALRAKSHEGKLQVHLAQLKYLLPRLVGQGIFLSRQAGGIGSRGPGESQLELSRRTIRQQIRDIEGKLQKVKKNRDSSRQNRLKERPFKIGLIGYTNAGKSTIMNQLTQQGHYEADELFATLDATTKQVYLASGFQATLTDTVGFIRDLPTELVSAFQSTLEESRQVDLLLHVVDASDPNSLEQEDVVLTLLADLAMTNIPRLTLYNKMDKVTTFEASQFPHIKLSATDPASKLQLRQAIIRQIKSLFQPFELTLAAKDSHRLYDLQKIALLEPYDPEASPIQLSGYLASHNSWYLASFYQSDKDSPAIVTGK